MDEFPTVLEAVLEFVDGGWPTKHFVPRAVPHGVLSDSDPGDEGANKNRKQRDHNEGTHLGFERGVLLL